jgi:hypothetical protein
VVLGTVLALVPGWTGLLPLPDMMGVLCGATTNTPALGAAQQTAHLATMVLLILHLLLLQALGGHTVVSAQYQALAHRGEEVGYADSQEYEHRHEVGCCLLHDV